MQLYFLCGVLRRELRAGEAAPTNTAANSTTSDAFLESVSFSDESTTTDGECLVPTDLFIAAVDHLVQDNHQIARRFDEIIEEKRQLSIYNDNLTRKQIEISQKAEDLQAEAEYLKQQNALLSAENDGLRLLNNCLSEENVDLEWTKAVLAQDIHRLKSENDALACKSARLDQECEELDRKFDHFKEIMQEVIAVKNRQYSNISADLVFVESDLARRDTSPILQAYSSPASPCMCLCPDHPPPSTSTPARHGGLRNSAGDSVSDNARGRSAVSSSLSSEIANETTLVSPPSPCPLGLKDKAGSSGSPKALQFASLLETVVLSPTTVQSLETVFNGNGLGLGLRLTPPSIDAVLASVETSPPLDSISPEHELAAAFRTSTPPPKCQLKKRAARLALRDNTNAVGLC